jgi:hypothetical protein
MIGVNISIFNSTLSESIEQGKVDVDHVRTDEQVVDILTKSLGHVKFVELRQMILN